MEGENSGDEILPSDDFTGEDKGVFLGEDPVGESFKLFPISPIREGGKRSVQDETPSGGARPSPTRSLLDISQNLSNVSCSASEMNINQSKLT